MGTQIDMDCPWCSRVINLKDDEHYCPSCGEDVNVLPTPSCWSLVWAAVALLGIIKIIWSAKP